MFYIYNNFKNFYGFKYFRTNVKAFADRIKIENEKLKKKLAENEKMLNELQQGLKQENQLRWEDYRISQWNIFVKNDRSDWLPKTVGTTSKESTFIINSWLGLFLTALKGWVIHLSQMKKAKTTCN